MSDEAVRMICGTAFYVSCIWAFAWISVAALDFIANIGKPQDKE